MGFHFDSQLNLGFIWHFRHDLPIWTRESRIRPGMLGRVDVSLVYQIGKRGRWTHFPGRSDWLARWPKNRLLGYRAHLREKMQIHPDRPSSRQLFVNVELEMTRSTLWAFGFEQGGE